MNHTTDKLICSSCVKDDFLKKEIKQNGQPGKCNYCSKKGKTDSIHELATRVERAFKEHYSQTSAYPNELEEALQRYLNEDWNRKGDPVICIIEEAAGIPHQAAQDIQQILEERYVPKHKRDSSFISGEETNFFHTSCYEEKDINSGNWLDKWDLFEESIKYEGRTYNPKVVKILADIFSRIDKISLTNNRSLIIKAGPNTEIESLYRARTFQSECDLEKALCRPDLEIGPPPPSITSAGRMNAHGIAVFYGARNEKVAMSEIRPPVGSWVAVAKFKIIRELQLLDLSALNDIIPEGSVFDPNYIKQCEYAAFLVILRDRIARPVLPNDEPFEYLATQVITEFLAFQTSFLIDGIIFDSAQTGKPGANVVLFNKSARVKNLNIPKSTRIEAYLNPDIDRPEETYEVIEWIPNENSGQKTNNTQVANSNDHRKESLEIELNKIIVHKVKQVKIITDKIGVNRRCIEENNTNATNESVISGLF